MGNRLLCGICGRARSGKNTFANYLIDGFFKHHNIKMEELAFATLLKEQCKQHFNLSDAQLWGNEKEVPDKRFVKADTDTYWTPREIMQAYGEFFRSIDNNYWVSALDAEIESTQKKYVVITDVRYKNECEYVKNNNGLLFKIVRTNRPVISNECHKSETELDELPNSYFDVLVTNDGSLNDLSWIANDVVINIFKITKWLLLKEENNG